MKTSCMLFLILAMGFCYCDTGYPDDDSRATDPNSSDDTETFNEASRKMVDLVKLTMQLSPAGIRLTETSKNKSQIVFSALSNRPTARNSNVTYSKSSATDGNPVNASSGVYTAKTGGLYGFIFHAVTMTNNMTSSFPTVELLVNGKSTATAAAYNGANFKVMTFIAGARLQPGDKVSVYVSGSPLFASGGKQRATFAGTVVN